MAVYHQFVSYTLRTEQGTHCTVSADAKHRLNDSSSTNIRDRFVDVFQAIIIGDQSLKRKLAILVQLRQKSIHTSM